MSMPAYTFTNPLLLEVSFQVNREFDVKKYGTVPMSSRGTTRKLSDNKSLVQLRIALGGESDAYPFAMTVEMASEFSWEGELSAEMKKRLLGQEAPAVLLSYIRPVAAQLTIQAGLPAFTIPPMEFTGGEVQ